MRALVVAVFCLAVSVSAPAWALKLERVVLVQRHGVRPPTKANADLARFAAQPWPAWPVAPGELTPHGAQTVALMGRSLKAVYQAKGVLPPSGCPADGAVVVWADGADQRTRRSGEVLAETLAPGCGLKAGWTEVRPRDPIFGAAPQSACRLDPAAAAADVTKSAGPEGVDTPQVRAALVRLQAILTPGGCDQSAGSCFAGKDTVIAGAKGASIEGPLADASGLAEDLLLEYAEGMPAADVGWGRAASEATIAEVFALHERPTRLMRRDPYLSDRVGAEMARLILAALAGEAGPHSGPNVRLLALAGHDTNLSLMGGVFGLDWTLADEPDATAPATSLVFELWSDHGRSFVRPVIYYETLDQLRSLSPARARAQPLQFDGCASGPLASCPLETLRARVLAAIPPGCGEMALKGA